MTAGDRTWKMLCLMEAALGFHDRDLAGSLNKP